MSVGHYENFPVASVLLPARLRYPVTLIYRFAREADDFADEGVQEPALRLQQLDEFRRQLRHIESGVTPEIAWFSELAVVIRKFNLPLSAFDDLLSAFSQDVVQPRYATFEDVMDYCRRSANPVGRLMLTLYGCVGSKELAWSDAICSSLQLINFLQDIEIDWRKNRIYLPQDEMQRFEVAEHEIARGQTGQRWAKFMAFQVDRARALMRRGEPLGRTLKGRIGLEMRMIIAGGNRILDKIERVQGDVFRHRPVVRPVDWPLMLARALRGA
ncbi:MAG: squalene synthase HpnC [Pseudomonadota bacterium]